MYKKLNVIAFNFVLLCMNNMIDPSPRSLIHILTYLRVEQVQEKKIKKISEMNVDPSKAIGNGVVGGSSSSRAYLANGGSSDRSYNYLSNDFSFPPGGIPSLKLPVVVVFSPFICNAFSNICLSRIKFSIWFLL